MDANASGFKPFNTRLIVRKGCVDSSKIRSREPKFPAPDSRVRSRMVAADVRKRILARIILPPHYVGGYGSRGDS